MLALHIIFLVIAIIAIICCLAALMKDDVPEAEYAIVLFLVIFNAILACYWGIRINEDIVGKAPQTVTIKTTTRPQVDVVVTNNTDTLFIYNFNKDQVIK